VEFEFEFLRYSRVRYVSLSVQLRNGITLEKMKRGKEENRRGKRKMKMKI
jgi:hypothetical protein